MVVVKFRTGNNLHIEALEIIRDMPRQIHYIDGKGVSRREAKFSNHQNWHETFDDAKRFLIYKIETEASELRRNLEITEHNLLAIQNFTNPSTKEAI